MKAIAKTTSNITLLDPITREMISDDRPYLVTWTQFMTSRAGLNQIDVLKPGLPADASAEEFEKFLEESKSEEQAIEAFLSTLETVSEPEPEPKPKKAAAKKGAE